MFMFYFNVSKDPEYLEFKIKRKPDKLNVKIAALNVEKEQNHTSVVIFKTANKNAIENHPSDKETSGSRKQVCKPEIWEQMLEKYLVI